MPDLLAKRDTPEVCYPNNDNGSGTTPGLSWAWSGWNQITASLAADLILTNLGVYTLISATASPMTGLINIEIGIGAAGSEVPIARAVTAIGYTSSGSTETKSIIKGETLDVFPVRINAGSRVAVRSTTSQAAAGIGCNVKLIGHPPGSYDPGAPLDAQAWLNARNVLGGSTAEPSLAVATVTTGGSLWAFGNWAQVITSAAAPLLVAGVASGGAIVSGGLDVEIGTGAAASEVTRALVPIVGRTFLPGPGWGYYRLARPLLVEPGERIAVRARGRPVSQAYDLQLQTHEVNN